MCKKMEQTNNQVVQFFIVLDFEATCIKNRRMDPQEIIEFAALKVNAETLEVDSEFSHFVRPIYHPKLSSFCIELTTISQADVDNARDFSDVFEDFCQWVTREKLERNSLFVTCGDWDLNQMLPNQCKLYGIKMPSYCKKWMNLLMTYEKSTGECVRSLDEMQKGLGINPTGIPHRAIDDCKNIVNILHTLADRGSKFYPMTK